MELSKKTMLRAGILEEFHDKDFDTFYGHPEKEKKLQSGIHKWNTANPDHPIRLDFMEGRRILDEVMVYVDNIERAKKSGISLYLWGPNGSGKTLLAVSVLKAILRKGYSGQMTSLGGIIETYTDGWYNPNKKEIFNERIRNVDFLLIDDIGKEYKAKGSDIVEVAFDNLIRYRSFRNKPFILTSNIDINNLSTTYGKSLASLLFGKCVSILVKGVDYRRVIQARNIRNILRHG